MLADPIFVLLGFESGVSDWVVGVLKSEGGVVFWIGKVLVEEPSSFVDVFVAIMEEGDGWTLLDVLRSFAGIWNWGETDWEVAGDVVGGTTGGTNGHRAHLSGEVLVGVLAGFDDAFGDDKAVLDLFADIADEGFRLGVVEKEVVFFSLDVIVGGIADAALRKLGDEHVGVGVIADWVELTADVLSLAIGEHFRSGSHHLIPFDWDFIGVAIVFFDPIL